MSFQPRAKADSLTQTEADGLVIGVFEEQREFPPDIALVDTALGGLLSEVINDEEIKGKPNDTALTHTGGKIPARRVLLVGLGKKDEFDADKVRQASAAALRFLRKRRCKAIAYSLLGADTEKLSLSENVRALIEGAVLGLYEPSAYKTEKDITPISDLSIVGLKAEDTSAAEASSNRGSIVAEAANYARELAYNPANKLTPTILAERAQETAEQYGIEIEIIDEDKMGELGMNALLSVTKGSEEPAKLIVLKNIKAEGKPTLGFIGKGVTFDSGGISLKPSEKMEDMKMDMSGAAAVLGATRAIAELGLKTNVITVMPCTENLPSGTATRPGDVVTALSGKTIEIINTDAEGRLILADAIAYAKKSGATHLIDLATLTGACVIALGHVATGLMSNKDDWAQKVQQAASRAGEKLWRLPLFDEYKEQLKSAIADMKNVGGKPAGTITAAKFLEEFAGDSPWVHLDIAGTAWSEDEKPHRAEGATGVGVRTLVYLAEDFSLE